MKKFSYTYFIINYLLTFLIVVYFIFNYEDNYGNNNYPLYSFQSMKLSEIISYCIYKYLLNFPLSFFVWFSDDLAYLTVFFFIPNSIATCYLINRYIEKKNRE